MSLSGLPHLVLGPGVRDALLLECNRMYPLETGGILAGTVENDAIAIHAVIGPGPRARHGKRDFTRDGDYAQAELESIVDLSGGTWDYAAERHSHGGPAGASSMDRRSMLEISRSPGYRSPEPVLVICCRDWRAGWFVRAYQYAGGKLIPLQVLEAA